MNLAIVSGTTSGIGAAVAHLLLDRGWSVVGIARRASSFQQPRYRHIRLDLRDLKTVAATFESDVAAMLTNNTWTRVALVNNAANPDLLTPLEQIDPAAMLDVFAVNAVAPVWLMGFVIRTAPRGAAVRIVNVSSGAAVAAFPGLAAYSSSKAALRMAGEVFAAELDSPQHASAAPPDTALLSYQPGTVDTPMQALARSQDSAVFPWVGMFRGFADRGVLVDAAVPAAEIVEFLESAAQPRIAERRLRQ